MGNAENWRKAPLTVGGGMVGGGLEHASAASSPTTQLLPQEEAGVSLSFFLCFFLSLSLH